MSVYLNKDGINSNDKFRIYNNNVYQGSRICLGFVAATGSVPYVHVKTTLGGSTNKMVKFEYDGFTYAALNVHNSVTFYTYTGTSVPYDASLVNWGESTGGIVNYYYSSDDYVVIVVQTNGVYTGGFLYVQSGYSHHDHTIDVMAYSSSSNITGVY
jgi:hypothetical protein